MNSLPNVLQTQIHNQEVNSAFQDQNMSPDARNIGSLDLGNPY